MIIRMYQPITHSIDIIETWRNLNNIGIKYLTVEYMQNNFLFMRRNPLSEQWGGTHPIKFKP